VQILKRKRAGEKEVANADEAVTLLREEWSICAVYTDIQMPGSMNGLALAQWIAEERPDVKVLLTSGHVAPPSCKAGNWSPSRMHWRSRSPTAWFDPLQLTPSGTVGSSGRNRGCFVAVIA
jgi:hypothetical protein